MTGERVRTRPRECTHSKPTMPLSATNYKFCAAFASLLFTCIEWQANTRGGSREREIEGHGGWLYKLTRKPVQTRISPDVRFSHTWLSVARALTCSRRGHHMCAYVCCWAVRDKSCGACPTVVWSVYRVRSRVEESFRQEVWMSFPLCNNVCIARLLCVHSRRVCLYLVNCSRSATGVLQCATK